MALKKSNGTNTNKLKTQLINHIYFIWWFC